MWWNGKNWWIPPIITGKHWQIFYYRKRVIYYLKRPFAGLSTLNSGIPLKTWFTIAFKKWKFKHLRGITTLILLAPTVKKRIIRQYYGIAICFAIILTSTYKIIGHTDNQRGKKSNNQNTFRKKEQATVKTATCRGIWNP